MSYAQPLLCVLLAVCGVALFRAGLLNRKSHRAVVLSFVLLWTLAWPPFAWLSTGSLEWRYRPGILPARDVQAIVVLGGGLAGTSTDLDESLLALDSYERTEYALSLFQRGWRLPVLVSGGTVRGGDSVAVAMARLLVSQGVPRELVWIEGRSRSTYQNAVNSAALLKQKGLLRIALVTSALHMPRAAAAFRHQGLSISPVPCCFQSRQYYWDVNLIFPSANAIVAVEASLHEWAGLAWYRFSGKT